MFSCFLGTTIYQSCPTNCRQTVVRQHSENETNCIAKEKLEAFLQDRVTFKVGISAFYQADPKILEKFIWESSDHLELITYYLYISDPTTVREIIESFSDHTLSYLFKSDFMTFLNVKDSTKRDRSIKHMFQVKSYRYWTFISYQRICDLIVYFVRELKLPEYACQFIVILPSNIVSNLKKYTSLTFEEEKSLYTALGDSIFELPIQSPKIYGHMIQLFAEEPEVYFVLETMEELIRRQEKILDTSEKLIEYTANHRIDLSIQFIFSELNGMDLGIAAEILNQLLEKNRITISQKSLVLDFLETGNLDILRPLRSDLIL
ncbi:hypothetical protein P3G55_00985 [Leptospira sp. 96542]|nr:hypothetical protein [Leptospira sp. 96542]